MGQTLKSYNIKLLTEVVMLWLCQCSIIYIPNFDIQSSVLMVVIKISGFIECR